jgi:anti-anti-sigma regulatory factor
MDSTRLGELIAAHITVSRVGGRLTLAATPPRVVELLTLAGLGGIFGRFDSVEDAAASLQPS